MIGSNSELETDTCMGCEVDIVLSTFLNEQFPAFICNMSKEEIFVNIRGLLILLCHHCCEDFYLCSSWDRILTANTLKTYIKENYGIPHF